ncbi:hypothetical protein G6F62_014112 [Rhizopus arrhizus]|nr:hypothetical protein G6F62_014112 [Rhizopus arrhizus]
MNYYKVADNKKAFYSSYNEELDLFQDMKRQHYLPQKSANLVTERALLDNIANLETDVRSRERGQID